MGKRLNTRLEATGAEFLVLGCLLIEGIQAYKTYTNFPGYDIIATNPDENLSCRIQVKSRWATDFDGGFPVKNFDCDFIVFVALNRGYRYRRMVTEADDGRLSPTIYVFPSDIVQIAQKPDSGWGKVFLKDIDVNTGSYIDAWDQIREFLQLYSES